MVELHIGIGKLEAEVPVGVLSLFAGSEGGHGEGALCLCGADIRAVAAAGAIQGAYLHAELIACEFLAGSGLGLKGNLGAVLDEEGTYAGMGANHGALVALCAGLGVPYGHFNGDTALLILGGGGGHAAVGSQLGNGQLVAVLSQYGFDEFLEVRIVGNVLNYLAFGGGSPGLGILDLFEAGGAGVDGGIVLLNHFVALLGVGLLGGGLHVVDGLIRGDYVGKYEEGGLHNGVDAVAHANAAGDLHAVHVVELDMLPGDDVLHGSGELMLHLGESPGGVEEEYAVILDVLKHVVLGHIGGVMAGDKVSRIDEVGALNGLLAETQMGYGKAAGLLGVVCEVALCVHVGVIAYDLYGVLVGADGTVGTKAVKHAGNGAFGSGVDLLLDGQGGEGDVVGDAHGEVVLHLAVQIVIHSLGHGGGELLGAQAVTAAYYLDVCAAALYQSVYNVLIQRLAQRTGFLGAVQNGDLLYGSGYSLYEPVGRERTVQADLQQTQLGAPGVQVIDGLFYYVCAAAHDDDDVLGVRCANVIVEVILAAGELANLVHIILYDVGQVDIQLVGSLAALEVDIGVLGGAGKMGMLGIEGAVAEALYGVPIQQLIHILIVDELYLLDFVGGAEAVEEVYEGYAGLDGGQMGHKRQIHNLLYGSGGKHCEAGLAAAHNVAVVAKDGKGMVREGTGGYVEYSGKLLAGDLVHVGDHEQQALGSGEGGGQGACLEGAVNCTGRTGLGLHLGYFNLLAKKVNAAVCCPIVCHFRHGGGRGDGVYRSYVAKRISNVRSSGITIDSHGFCHCDVTS